MSEQWIVALTAELEVAGLVETSERADGRIVVRLTDDGRRYVEERALGIRRKPDPLDRLEEQP